MVDQRYVDYVRANKDKFPTEAIKEALAKAGLAIPDIEEAVRLASLPPAPMMSAPPPPDPADGPPSPAAAKGILSLALDVALRPDDFFRSMPRTGGLRAPLIFAFVMCLIGLVLRLCAMLASGLLSSVPGGIGLFGMAIGLLAGLIMTPIGFLIGAAIAHVIWLILGSRQPFETSFRCVAYMAALYPAQMAARAVPGIGMWLAIPVSLYGIYLFVPASVEAHGIERRKASIAAGVCALFAIFSLLSSALFAWKMRRMLPTAQLAALQSLARAPRAAQLGAFGSSSQSPDPAQAMGSALQALGQASAALQSLSGPQTTGAPATQGSAPQNLSPAPPQAAKAVEPAALKALIPAALPGMARTGYESARQQLGPVEASFAQGTYEDASGGRITIKITDAGSYSSLLAAAWGFMNVDQEDQEGFKRSVQYRGWRALEEHRKRDQSSSIHMLVGQRFVIELTGRSVAMDSVRSSLDAINLDALARLAP